MARYFIELGYKGAAYAGFQVQKNANTIQGETEKALQTYYRKPFSLTGSSRTDAGVHARQNYFQFDTEDIFTVADTTKAVYHLNAILPSDIVIRSIRRVKDDAHCRFDAISRSYIYTVYTGKDPFLDDRAHYFPFAFDKEVLQASAAMIMNYTDFTSFSKKNSQAYTNECRILESRWEFGENELYYTVKANRFLRGMVRGLTGTMLQAGRGKHTIAGFKKIIEGKNAAETDFSVPGKGLVLDAVTYPADIFHW